MCKEVFFSAFATTVTSTHTHTHTHRQARTHMHTNRHTHTHAHTHTHPLTPPSASCIAVLNSHKRETQEYLTSKT
uniref:Uncharacterized protein n=1 Tax=Anguilla anguilla TaxID=7936 RepID=A0A0E9WYU7_ANGAN